MADFRKGSALVWGVLFAVFLGGLAPAAASDNKQLDEIIDGARKEGRLSIVHSQGVEGGPSSGLREGFNKYYGLNLDVQFTPGPSMADLASQILQQVQSKRVPVTDVLAGYAINMFSATKGNALEAVDWKSWAPNVQQANPVSSDGSAVPIQTAISGIVYNTNVFKGTDAPKAMRDFLRPSLKGRVATTPYAASFDVLGSDELWGRDKTLAFVRELSPQLGGLIRCNEITRIASGEFDAFAFSCLQNEALRLAAKGAPVGIVAASDAPIIMDLYNAVPVNAAHPNAAKLWINYLLTREAQDLLYKAEFADLSRLKGSKSAELIHAIEGQGVKPVVVDVAFYRTHDEATLNDIVIEARQAFRSR